MKQIVTNQTVKIPEGLTVTVKSRLVTVKGPRGVLKRSFKHLALDIRVSGKKSLFDIINSSITIIINLFWTELWKRYNRLISLQNMSN